MKKFWQGILVGVFVLAAMPALSWAGTVNFAGYSDLTVLTTQEFGDGVTFAGTTILQCCATDGSGSLNNAQFPPPADDGGQTDGVNVAYNPSGPLQLSFTVPTDFFNAVFTYNDGLTVTAYDSSLDVLDVVNGACGASGSGGANYVGSGCGAPNELLSVNDLAGISEIIITGGSGDNFTIDDVNFMGSVNAGEVPEPSSLLLLGTGLLGLAFVAFRKSTASGAASII